MLEPKRKEVFEEFVKRRTGKTKEQLSKEELLKLMETYEFSGSKTQVVTK